MDERLASVRPLIRTRQIRQFTDEPVGDADLHALTEVARWTGSSQNTQRWRFVVIRDVELIRRIAVIGQNQTRSLHTAMAAIAIVMPDEPERASGRAYDEGRVAERILVGASMLGLGAGIAWLLPDVRPQVAELLGVPATHMIRTIMAVGHPSEAAQAPKSAPGQARKPREELVMDGRWR